MTQKRCPHCGSDHTVCDKCGKRQFTDPERAGWSAVPPPYGSLDSRYPMFVCAECNRALAALVFAWRGWDVPPSLLPPEVTA